MTERITSASNPRVKRLTALGRKAKLRREERVFIIEGERLYTDTPRKYLKEIYMTEEFLGEKLGGAAPDNCTIVTPEIMRKISDTDTPQGVLCVAKMPSYTRKDLLGSADGRTPLLLLLENIQDPGNLGTMMRTAEAAGVTGVMMSRDTVDLFNPKTVRATMSAIFRMPFLYTDDLVGEIGQLREDGIAVYAAHLRASRPYDEADCGKPCAFLIGNEGNGLSEEAANAASGRVHIPMQGSIESLNAAMAAGILMFEAARQRRKN